MSPIPGSTVRCRGMNCGAILIYPDEAVPARKVLGGNARGWFCRTCAKRWSRR